MSAVFFKRVESTARTFNANCQVMFTRRKYPRFPVSGEAIVRTASKDVVFPGSIERFSRGGLGIYTNVSVERGTPIRLEVSIFTGTESSKHLMTGVVKNFSKWGEKGLLGVEFEQEIGPHHEPHLYQYLGILERELIKDYNRLDNNV